MTPEKPQPSRVVAILNREAGRYSSGPFVRSALRDLLADLRASGEPREVVVLDRRTMKPVLYARGT